MEVVGDGATRSLPHSTTHFVINICGGASAVHLDQAVLRVVPGMIVRERWLPIASLGMRIHGRREKSVRVSAPGTGAGDLPVSDAVRGGSLAGRPIILMGFEPAVVSGRPATRPVEL